MLEINRKCKLCQRFFKRPAADRVPVGYCTTCWEKAEQHRHECDDLADRQAVGAKAAGVQVVMGDEMREGIIRPRQVWVAPCMDCGAYEGEMHHRSCVRNEQRMPKAADPAAHYRHVIRAPITDDDIARGYTEAKLDPYRVCDVYQTGGGPREQMIKKLLRWTDKGQSEDKVIAEIESALKRWKEMREEDAACTR